MSFAAIHRINTPHFFHRTTIFAWSGALRKRAELDGLADLAAFADALERATVETIEGGVMTKDLAALSELPDKTQVDTFGFLDAIAVRLEGLLKA